MMRFHQRALVFSVLVVLLAGPGGAATYKFKSPSDSVRFRIGNFDKWINLAEVKSPDTSHLNSMLHDLTLYAGQDSLVIRAQIEAATVNFELPSGMLTEVLVFKVPLDTARIALLRKYPKFKEDSLAESLSLTYRRSSDSVLAELRHKYGLDSIAGDGPVGAKAVRLLKWVHMTVRHDGTKEDPVGQTILDKLRACTDSGATMSCGGLAHLLADVYASVGLRARTVVGMPYDTADHECHQITEVWSDDDGRWLFMDPTNNAYFTDKSGRILQTDEVRQFWALGQLQRMDEFVRMNPDANWNGIPKEQDEYFNYMAKNMFRFRTWAVPSTDNSERVWTIELTPDGYDNVNQGLTRDTSGEVTFRTHDISLFWKPPVGAKGW